MARQPKKTIEELVAEVGRYPIEAYQFIRDGLAFAVERIHGKETQTEARVHRFMHEHNLNLARLHDLYEAGKLPKSITRYIEKAGGVQGLNRHVTGQELCWGLRDYALKRWGLLASAVLKGWNVTSTADFGRIVFALVENDFMQKEPHDTIEDFYEVYDFKTAFETCFKIKADEEGPG
jgi:uncharacterized repeat protein (TIGR04138 family)